MTPQQHQALVFIRASWADRGHPPLLSEIADELGIKTRSGAKRVVDALVALGAVTVDRGRRYSITPIDQGLKVALRAEIRNALDAYAKAHAISPEVAAAEAIQAYVGGAS